MTLGDAWRAVRRRWKSTFVVTLLVSLAVVALLVAWPNRYASEGMLFVRLGRGSVSLDPASTASATVSLQESRAAEVASVREILASRAIAERVVDAIGQDEILRPRHWSAALAQSLARRRPGWAGGPATDGSPQSQQYAQAIEREEAIAAVQDALNVHVAKDSYTLIVQARSGDPYLSRAIVQTAMDQCNGYHVQAHRSDGSLAFFDRQHQQAFEAAVAAQQELKESKNRMGLLSAESMELTLRERITQLQTALDQTRAQRQASQAEVEQLQQQIASLDQWVPTATTQGVANGAGEDMRTALFGLELESSDTAARFTPEHPRYQQMQERLAVSKAIVGQQTQERMLTQEALNPIRQNLETTLRQSQARSAGLDAQLQSLQSLQEAADAQLQRLNGDAVQLAQLQWQASVAEQNYLAHAQSLEQARVMHALDAEQMSDLSVVQPAALMLKKVGPPRMVLSLVGCLLGLALGLLQALLRDASPATIRHANGHRHVHLPAERQAVAAGFPSQASEDAVLAGPARPR